MEKTITFMRPAPYSKELFTEESQEKFNSLQGWQRQLVAKLIETGDLKRAITEAGADLAKQLIPKSQDAIQALDAAGYTIDQIVQILSTCIDTPKFDKDGKVIGTDKEMTRKIMDMFLKIRGEYFIKQKRRQIDVEDVYALPDPTNSS